MNNWPLVAWLLLMSGLAVSVFAIKLAVKRFRQRGVEDNISAARRRAAMQKNPGAVQLSAAPKNAGNSVAAALESHRRMASNLMDAANTSTGNWEKNQFNRSGQYNLPVRWTVDYQDRFGEMTTRTIRVQHLRLRPQMVEAYCESRCEYRSFYISSIKKAVDPASGREVDVQSYVRHVRQMRSR